MRKPTAAISFNITENKEKKRKLVEEYTQIQASRRPFKLDMIKLKPTQKPQKTQQLKSFISKLDRNWNKIQNGIEMRNKYITANSLSQYGLEDSSASLKARSIDKQLLNKKKFMNVRPNPKFANVTTDTRTDVKYGKLIKRGMLNMSHRHKNNLEHPEISLSDLGKCELRTKLDF